MERTDAALPQRLDPATAKSVCLLTQGQRLGYNTLQPERRFLRLGWRLSCPRGRINQNAFHVAAHTVFYTA